MRNRPLYEALKKGLTQGEDGKQGALCGKTHAEMARILSGELGTNFNRKQIAYGIAQIKATSGNSTISSKRGRPIGTQKNTWGAIFNELLVLTGLTASKLFPEMPKIMGENEGKISRATFYKWLKHPSGLQPTPTPKSRKIKFKRNPYCLRVHACFFECMQTGAPLVVVVLAAYEQKTGFIYCVLLKITTTPRKRGRPRKIDPNPSPADQYSVICFKRQNELRVEFDPEEIDAFISTVIEYFGLPIRRITLSKSIATNIAPTTPNAKNKSLGITVDDQPYQQYLPYKISKNQLIALEKNLKGRIKAFQRDETHNAWYSSEDLKGQMRCSTKKAPSPSPMPQLKPPERA